MILWRRTARTEADSTARRRVLGYCVLALIAVGLSTLASTIPLLSGHSEVLQVRHDDVALQQVADLRTSLSNYQVFLEPHLAKLAPASPNDLANGALLSQAVTPQTGAVAKSLSALGLAKSAAMLRDADQRLVTASTGLSVIAAGVVSAQTNAAIAAERAAYTLMLSVSGSANAQLHAIRDVDLAQATGFLDHGRAAVLVVEVLTAVVIVTAGTVFGRRARRRELGETVNRRRLAFESALQQALEMAKSEVAVYGIVEQALDQTVPGLRSELLLADSSRAHFHQMLGTTTENADGRRGCGVVSPFDCPATVRGHTLVFASSRALDACPYLRDREAGECSAACVALSIAGNTTGVLHATGPDLEPPSESDIRYLELTARRASERIGMLRAFEQSETQARSDPLTGLWNRRSLENRVHDLEADGVPFSVAYGDLDHFKALNDTHGHEAGDQALRLFARVLRDSIRPNDIPSRYGGEEFVIVLPDASIEAAGSVLERVRDRLALALTSGRVASFTVSFGLASSSDADTFDDIVAVADRALLAAKEEGRDRVVRIHPEAEGPPVEVTAPEPAAGPVARARGSRPTVVH